MRQAWAQKQLRKALARQERRKRKKARLKFKGTAYQADYRKEFFKRLSDAFYYHGEATTAAKYAEWAGSKEGLRKHQESRVYQYVGYGKEYVQEARAARLAYEASKPFNYRVALFA